MDNCNETVHRSYHIDSDVASLLDAMWLRTGKRHSVLINEAVRKAYTSQRNDRNDGADN